MATHVDSDQYTKPFLLTQTSRRSPYPAISPEKPENSQAGKIIIITGGGSGIDAVRLPCFQTPQHLSSKSITGGS